MCAYTYMPCHAMPLSEYGQCFCCSVYVFVSNKMPYDLVCTCYIEICGLYVDTFYLTFVVVRDQILPGTHKTKLKMLSFFVFLDVWVLLYVSCKTLCHRVSLDSAWWMEQQQINMSLNECEFDFVENKPVFSHFELQHINYTISVVIWCAKFTDNSNTKCRCFACSLK